MDLLLILGAAFFAGILNSVAGGGSFLTLPALIAVGVPPVMANATGTLALLPGYFSGAWAMKRDLFAEPHSIPLARTVLITAAGGAAGALLLLWIDPKIFRFLAPWLLLLATLIFWLAPMVLWRLKQATAPGSGRGIKAQASLAAASIYGGFFNGGIGIMLLALFSAAGHQNLNTMNALKNLLSGVLTSIAVVVYVAGGLIHWHYAMLMLVAALIGGYAGGKLAQRLPTIFLRIGIILLGLTMTAYMFVHL